MRTFLLSLVVGLAIILSACPTAHYATVSWRPGGTYASTVQYRVYKSQLPTSGFVLAATEPQPITDWTDLSVQVGETYYYRITAYDTANNSESAPSIVVSTIIP